MIHFTVFYGNAAEVSQVLVIVLFCFFSLFSRILHSRVQFYQL